jgi:hypothetical protein
MFRMMLRATLLTTAVLAVAAPALATDLTKFVGRWSCKGNFSNGAPIAGELSMDADAPTGALIVRHDDVAPGEYHSLEIWMPNKSGAGLRAAISDKFSGMRWLESAGWTGGALTWVRTENGAPIEQFTYDFKADTMQVQWSIVRDGVMKLGDTLRCSRAQAF